MVSKRWRFGQPDTPKRWMGEHSNPDDDDDNDNDDDNDDNDRETTCMRAVSGPRRGSTRHRRQS